MLSKHHIREMAESGLFKIGAHTVNHPKLNKLSYKEQKFEIEYSKKFLEDLVGMEIVDFAYPFGKYNEITLQILQERGFKRAYTVIPSSLKNICNPFLIGRMPILKTTTHYFETLLCEGYLKYCNYRRVYP